MSADLLREAAASLRESSTTGTYGDPCAECGTTGAFTDAVADWLEAEAEGDGHKPHRFPTPAPDGEVIAWACAECGETVNDGAALGRTECPVDWRLRAVQALAVARAHLGGQS